MSFIHDIYEFRKSFRHIEKLTLSCVHLKNAVEYIYIYIYDVDTNIVSKMSVFADDTKLCHRARNPDDIMEQQENINKLAEWANKWQMSLNVDNCSVMHIGHNNMQSNYNI